MGGWLAYWVGGVTPARFDVLRRHGLGVHAQEKLCVGVVFGWLTVKPVSRARELPILPAVELDARYQFSVCVVAPLFPVDVYYRFHFVYPWLGLQTPRGVSSLQDSSVQLSFFSSLMMSLSIHL